MNHRHRLEKLEQHHLPQAPAGACHTCGNAYPINMRWGDKLPCPGCGCSVIVRTPDGPGIMETIDWAPWMAERGIRYDVLQKGRDL